MLLQSRQKYTNCNLKTMELLDRMLIGVCAVIRLNTVIYIFFVWIQYFCGLSLYGPIINHLIINRLHPIINCLKINRLIKRFQCIINRTFQWSNIPVGLDKNGYQVNIFLIST